MTDEQLAEIRKRVEKVAKGNMFREVDVLTCNNTVVFEDVPKLLAEIWYLRDIIALSRCEECGDELGENWVDDDGITFQLCAEGDEEE